MNRLLTLNQGLIEEFPFEAARDLLDFLNLTNPRWSHKWECRWVFRGQGDADWGLVPSAWRATDSAFNELRARMESASAAAMFEHQKRYKLPCQWDLRRLHKCLGQAAAEVEIVGAFVSTADQIGLPVLNPPANDGFTLIMDVHSKPEPVKYEPPFFPPPTSAFGLAQHYGIPTRLLDFSHRPEVAAFFAADDVIDKRWTGGRLAIWAVEKVHCTLSTGFRLDSVTVPRAEHNYLHAQDGLFLWAPDGDRDGILADGMTHRSLEGIADQAKILSENLPVFRKATLPHGEAAELLRLLHLRQVTRAHLMPSYDSVAKVVKRRILLQLSEESTQGGEHRPGHES